MKPGRDVRRAAAGAALLAGVGLSASAAEAQTRTGWALNRYEPSPMGDVFFLAEHPWYSSTRAFSVGLYGDYAVNPLRVRASDGTTTTDVDDITGMLSLHVGAQVSFLDRVGVHLSLPVSLLQSGQVPTAATVVGPADGPAVGDLRAGLRFRVFGHADRDPFSVHLGAQLWAPVGSRESNTGDESIRIEPRLTLAGRGGPVRWSLGGGFTVRAKNDVVNLAFGNELRLSGAVGFVFANDRLTIGPEAYVFTPLRDLSGAPAQGTGSALFKSGQWGAEVYLGINYLIADAVLLGVAGGPGIEQGAGIPAARGIVRVAYAPVRREAPPPPDTDRDGVIDPNDQCPTVPQGSRPDPTRVGCPLLDTDSDGVYDDTDQCVSVPQGANPDPARPGCPLADADSDGVFDPQDQCPTVPQGATPDPARPGCPAGDRDNDGVLDPQDQCPDEPRGTFPDPARPGCPLPDADHDQVPEPPDACPGVPGVPSPDPARNGCPNQDVRLEGGQIRILQQVFFDTDRDTIKRRSDRVLQAVADVLRGAPHIRRVSVDGHTDDRSSMEHNMDLSQRRANSVRRWLIEHGVEEARLEAHGYGPTRPIDSNGTSAGRARNRRVEFVIVDPPQPGAPAPTAGPQVAPASSAPPPSVSIGAPTGAPGGSGAPPVAQPAAPAAPAAQPAEGGGRRRRRSR